MTRSIARDSLAPVHAALIVLLCLAAVHDAAFSQTLTLTAPRAGDSVIRGGTYVVKWDPSSDLTGSASLTLTRLDPSLGGPQALWTQDVPIASRSYSWQVTEEPGAGYMLTLAHASASATSGAFTVGRWTFAYDRDSNYTVPSTGTLFDNLVTLNPTCLVSDDLGVGSHGRQVQYFGYGDITGQVGITHWMDGVTQYDDGEGGTYYGGDGIAVRTAAPMIDVSKDLVVKFKARKAADLGTRQGYDVIEFFVASPTPSPIRMNPVGVLHYPADYFVVNLRGGPTNYLKVGAVADGLQSGSCAYDGIESLNTTQWHDYRVEIAAGSTTPRLCVDNASIAPLAGPPWTIRPLSEWDGVNVYFACASITQAGVTNYLYVEDLEVINDSAAVRVAVDPGVGFADRGVTLWQNHPNPANGMTTMRFALPVAGPVRLAVYDLQGRVVAVPIDEDLPAGEHVVQVDCGRTPPGVYACRLEAGSVIRTRRMVVMK